MRTVSWKEIQATAGELVNSNEGHHWTIKNGQCEPTDAAVLTGTGLTDPHGIWILDLPSYTCLKGIGRVISVLLTPTYGEQGAKPGKPIPHLTAFIKGLQVEVRSSTEVWAPIPMATFSWLIVVEGHFG